ncbi:MAG: hypothetical protein AAGC55_01420, partial [Myxococcota bacterium]
MARNCAATGDIIREMALIRIVDAWLRSPASPPTHRRVVMVVAESWSEQRILMRAYADSPDQTRPTITLHGSQLAISPASTDPHGPWGIHVEPAVDGRAQHLRDQLHLAARRLAGSRGNPPRLADEESRFDRKHTNHWAPGTPRDLPERPVSAGPDTPTIAVSAAAISHAPPGPAEVGPPAPRPP